MNTTAAEAALVEEASYFIYICYNELGKSEAELVSRVAEVTDEIQKTGLYTHTFEELEHGARMAWRNNNRCIGRLFWNTLTVFDARQQTTADGAFDA